MIANLGLAAGTVGAEHIKPKSPNEEDVKDGIRAFLNAFQNILHQAGTGAGNDVGTIKVRDDAESVHIFHPITGEDENPFRTSLDSVRSAPVEGASPLEHREFPFTRETSFGEFARDIAMLEKESGQKMFGRARLDTGMTFNAIRQGLTLKLRYAIEDCNDVSCIVGDGTEFRPLGRVTIPFHFVNSGNAKTWDLEFVVFPDEAPFDVCLGRRFISSAHLLKSNDEALPVKFRPLSAAEEQDQRLGTYQARHNSERRKATEDSMYHDRRTTKLKSNEPKSPYRSSRSK